jgi:iron complex outermembrane receptor protein
MRPVGRSLAIIALLSGADLSVLASSARAQSTGDASTSTEPVADAQGSGLEEIVVSARRRDERLQEVPLAVTAITSDTLQASGVSTTTQLAQAVPGFVSGRSANNIQPVLRGVGTNYGGAGNESPVAFYVDGIYQPEPLSNTIDLLNAERVEVLRGPQGTLFGRNATGGLINIITPNPTYDPQAQLSLRYGSFDELSARGYVSAGLTDKVAVDFAAMVRKNDGHIRDLQRGGKTDALNSVAARTKLLFEPTEALSIVLTANYAKLKNSGLSSSINLTNNTVGRAIDPNTPVGNYSLYVGDVRPVTESSTRSASLRITGDLGNIQVESTSSYAHFRAFNASDIDASAVGVADVFILNKSDAYSQEFRLLSGDSDRFNWTAGVNGFWNSADQFFDIRQGIGASRISIDPHTTTRALSVFAEGTMSFLDDFKLTVGGRYTSERRGIVQTINRRELYDLHTTFNKFTPRVILQYVPNSNLNLYASYSVGFKSGLYNSQTVAMTPARPETNKAYEAGIKADPTSWLRTNIAAFIYDYTDLQVTVRPPGSGTSILQNSAAAKIKGVEAELSVAPVSNLVFGFQGAYLDAKYTSFRDTLVTVPTGAGGNTSVSFDASGQRMLRAPKLTYSGNVKYTYELSSGAIEFRGSAYHSSRVKYSLDGRLSQGPYWLSNAQIAYVQADEKLRLSFSVQNIGNRHVVENILSTAFGDTYSFDQVPRSYFVGLDLRF